MQHLMPEIYNALIVLATVVVIMIVVVILVSLLKRRNASIRFSLLKILEIQIELKEKDASDK